MSHVQNYFQEVVQISSNIDIEEIDRMAEVLKNLRDNSGRLFFLGVGGSAGNCSHAVNDFRKLCGIESYAPVDNVSELTARTNDEGWDTVFSEFLRISNLSDRDALFILSVGGGDKNKNVSTNLIKAIDFAKERGAKVLGIVGRSEGYTAIHGNSVIVVPQVNEKRITPHSEAFQAVVWHCLVSHPDLQLVQTKW